MGGPVVGARERDDATLDFGRGVRRRTYPSLKAELI